MMLVIYAAQHQQNLLFFILTQKTNKLDTLPALDHLRGSNNSLVQHDKQKISQM